MTTPPTHTMPEANRLHSLTRRTHRVCLVCEPDPQCGSLAVCGDMIFGETPKHPSIPCVRCARTWKAHIRKHFGGGR
jgi:hypothetical protein